MDPVESMSDPEDDSSSEESEYQESTYQPSTSSQGSRSGWKTSSDPPLNIKIVDSLITAAQEIVSLGGFSESSQVCQRLDKAVQAVNKIKETKLLYAVCGSRGAGKSDFVNRLVCGSNKIRSLSGSLPLPSEPNANRITEAPTYLIHSQNSYLKIVWNCKAFNDASLTFDKNKEGECFSECWDQALLRFGDLNQIDDLQFRRCHNQAPSKETKDELLSIG